MSPRARQLPEIAMLIEATVDELDARKLGWQDALRQDAVESLGRMSWRRHVTGIHVPVYEMMVVPLERGMHALSRHFARDVVPLVVTLTGGAAPDLIEQAAVLPEPHPVSREQADMNIVRDWLEKNVPFRQRFERQLVEHADHLYREHIRPAFRAHLEGVIDAWTS